MATVTLTDPTVSGSNNTWGATLNANHTLIENAFNGASLIEPALTEGGWEIGATTVTATGAEVNRLAGLTYNLTNLNSLSATVTELNYSSGVTSAIQTQLDARQPLDATLTALAGLATGADKIPYSTGSDTFGQLDFADEDDMSSDSDTAVPSQQSVKAYVDDLITKTGTAPVFGVRAFCVWDASGATGSTTPQASGNIATLTKDGSGLWTVAFTTAMPDEYYAVSYTGGKAVASSDNQPVMNIHSRSASGFSFAISDGTGNNYNNYPVNSLTVVR